MASGRSFGRFLIKGQGSGGGSGSEYPTVENFASLPDPTTVPESVYLVLNSQGTKWLPFNWGGTFYNAGLYYSDGISWKFITEIPYQATQADVDAGIIDNQFVSPSTLSGWWTWIKTQLQIFSGGVNVNGETAALKFYNTAGNQYAGDIGRDAAAGISLNAHLSDLRLQTGSGGGHIRLTTAGSGKDIILSPTRNIIFNKSVSNTPVVSPISGAIISNLTASNLFFYTLTSDSSLDYSNPLPGYFTWIIETAGFNLTFAANKFQAEAAPVISGKIRINGIYDGNYMCIEVTKDLALI